MRRTVGIFLVLLAPLASAQAPRHATDRVLVQLTESLGQPAIDGAFSLTTGRPALDDAIAGSGVQRIEPVFARTLADPRHRERHRQHGLDRVYRFELPEGAPIAEIVARLQGLEGVVYAEPDYVDRATATPDDPLLPSQWGLGQPSDADVDAAEAWDISTGDRFVIAVLDSGIEHAHSDFSGKLTPGIDVVNNDNDPEDDQNHGTQVAGVAAARTNNTLGVAGACWQCLVMPIKALDQVGDGLVSWYADAVTWAVDNGADVINYSAGGPHAETRLLAVQYAWDRGVLHVAAAGNGGASTGAIGFPARYGQVLAVGGSNAQDEKWTPSSRGRALDHIAPSEGIWTTHTGSTYLPVSGTSFSSPLVAGLAGLVLDVHPSPGREEIRDLINLAAEDQVGDPADDEPGWDTFHGFGRVNMHQTLQAAESAATLRLQGALATRVFHETANPVATSYDFIRGSLSSLGGSPAGVNLGAVLCLENDSPDADTAGNLDTDTPPVGEAFFYLSRFNREPWMSSFGGSSLRRDRIPEPPTSAADWILDGTASDGDFGTSTSIVGDVNDDGFDDVLVGAPNEPTTLGDGVAYLFLGTASGPAATPAWTLESDEQDSALGFAVGPAGDVNNDGFADVIIGEYLRDGALGSNEGRALVFLGGPGGLGATAHRILRDPQANARFGVWVGTAGDINDDGFDDTVVVADRYDGALSDEGRVYVYYGSGSGLPAGASWTWTSGSANARIEIAQTAGDVNNDGPDDLIVGSPRFDGVDNNQGRAWIFLGSDPVGLPGSPSQTLQFGGASTFFGAWAATAGDVNDDGRDDVVVVGDRYSNGENEEGGVWVFHGTASGVSATPSWSFETDQILGRVASATGVGDMDGDGVDDLIVGSNYHHHRRVSEGRAWLFLGNTGSGLSSAESWSDHGRQTVAEFGEVVAGRGDIDNDGRPDVLVAAPFYNVDGGYDEGRIYIYRGIQGTGLVATPIDPCELPAP